MNDEWQEAWGASAVTDADAAAREALARFFPGERLTARGGPSGMNNTTRYVERQGALYVLRVYETHRDEEKVGFELAVLTALARRPLPFRVPEPVPAPEGVCVRLEDGRLAALFRHIDGARPDPTRPGAARGLGRAAGALSEALRGVRVGLRPAYPPYYELDAAHPLCPTEAVERFCAAPPATFQGCAAPLARLGQELERIRRSLPALRSLPHQLVHGDLNASNMLVRPDGEAAAVLDFEFVTRDLRVMEAAVCLSDLLNGDRGAAETAELAAEFAAGYGAASRLSASEAEAIPLLLRLRRLDVFLHFLGRYRDGVDDADKLRGFIDGGAAALDRFDGLREPLARAIRPMIGE
ncbi:phosphotransferase [Paenibacillus sp.]|uniref:phosphotransferase n=1 Tax=Paenibacillus sp. TaxID=58172 RepID=UPI002D46B7D0|nr:phosphotransferase [Paenibacillus sp.]HZG83476.1 phosphotransferase [Paenibacillus sp.]